MKHVALIGAMAGIIALASCSNRQGGEVPVELYTLDDFETVEMKDSDAVAVNVPGLDLLRPYRMKYAGEGRLVLQDDAHPEGMLTIVDTRQDTVMYHVSKGRGPGEMLSIFQMSVKDGDIWLSGTQDRKVMRVSIDAGIVSDTTFIMKDEFMKAVPFGEESVLALSSPFSGRRLDLMTLSGETCDSVKVFPVLKDSPDTPADNALFQSEIAVSPDSRHTAVACLSFEYIDIYDGKLKLTHRLSGPEAVAQKAELISVPIGKIYRQKPNYKIHNCLVCNDKGFMVGYIGLELTDPSQLAAQARTILSFDWNGKPGKAYHFESELTCFDIDRENNILYGLVAADEPYILKWQL